MRGWKCLFPWKFTIPGSNFTYVTITVNDDLCCTYNIYSHRYHRKFMKINVEQFPIQSPYFNDFFYFNLIKNIHNTYKKGLLVNKRLVKISDTLASPAKRHRKLAINRYQIFEAPPGMLICEMCGKFDKNSHLMKIHKSKAHINDFIL